MKLDPTVMRTMNAHDYIVLAAVEKGMKDHALVPLPLISAIATSDLRLGGTHKIVSSLLRDKLLSHERPRGKGVDGYRVTNAGYDILALHHLKQRGFVAALGPRIGTGKESDIYLASSPTGNQVVLKLHRLGRTSFRNVKQKRDYFNNKSNKSSPHGQAHSWLFLSRLSALKEYAFMKALYETCSNSIPTPTPIAHNRHVVVMSLVRGMPLYQILPRQLDEAQAQDIYSQGVLLAAQLARHGLVHCDLNEFNLLVDLSGIQALATADQEDPYIRHSGHSVVTSTTASSKREAQSWSVAGGGPLSRPAWEQSIEDGDKITPEVLPEPAARLENGLPKPIVTLIDFPQMISTSHVNAQDYYERDLQCLRTFFERKLHCQIPTNDDLAQEIQWNTVTAKTAGNNSSNATSSNDNNANDDNNNNSLLNRLDVELRASGYTAQDDATMSEHLQLYYFENGPRPIASAVAEEEEEEEDDNDSNGAEDDECNAKYDDEHDDFQCNLDEDNDSNDNDQANRVEIIRDDDDNDNHSLLSRNTTRTTTTLLSRAELEATAKARVRRQLEDQRRRSKKQGAFRNTRRNSNKEYVKGKRVMSESF